MSTTTSQPGVRLGVERLLSDYASLTESDTCVIAYTPDSREPAAWIAAGAKARGLHPRVVPMLPLADAEFEERLTAAVSQDRAADGRLVVVTVERETMSHFGPLSRLAERLPDDRCMILRIIGASADFFSEAFNVPPSELSQRNSALLNRFVPAKELRISARGGTDLAVTLDATRFDWISNRGVWRPGGFVILPAGEVATYPARISGRLVADGAFNCNVITRLDTRLTEHPVTVTIEDGLATDYACDDGGVRDLLDMCMSRANGRRVGELGFGTNAGISRYVEMNSHVNERRPGVHLGFGQHNQDKAAVPYHEDVHLDLIVDGARVQVDGAEDVVDLDDLVPSSRPHPVGVRDEDIVGNCCSYRISRAGECVVVEAATP